VYARGSDRAPLCGPSTFALAAYMEHCEFHIGLEFWSGGKKWRCTDVGTRVVAAISLEPHEVVEITSVGGNEDRARERRYLTNDPSWHIGPPYPVLEHLFDEDDQETCSSKPMNDYGT